MNTEDALKQFQDLDDLLSVPEQERITLGRELEVGKWPGDESATKTVQRGSKRSLDALAAERRPVLEQVQKARKQEAEFHPFPRLERAAQSVQDWFTPSRSVPESVMNLDPSTPSPVSPTATKPAPRYPQGPPTPQAGLIDRPEGGHSSRIMIGIDDPRLGPGESEIPLLVPGNELAGREVFASETDDQGNPIPGGKRFGKREATKEEVERAYQWALKHPEVIRRVGQQTADDDSLDAPAAQSGTASLPQALQADPSFDERNQAFQSRMFRLPKLDAHLATNPVPKERTITDEVVATNPVTLPPPQLRPSMEATRLGLNPDQLMANRSPVEKYVTEPLKEFGKSAVYRGPVAFFDWLDRKSTQAAKAVGITPSGSGLYKKIADLARAQAEDQPLDPSWSTQFLSELGQVPTRDLPKIAAFTSSLGPIWGFAGMGVLDGAEKGTKEALVEGFKGLLTGASFQGLHGLGMGQRATAGGALFGAQAAAEGERDPGKLAGHALTGAILSAPGPVRGESFGERVKGYQASSARPAGSNIFENLGVDPETATISDVRLAFRDRAGSLKEATVSAKTDAERLAFTKQFNDLRRDFKAAESILGKTTPAPAEMQPSGPQAALPPGKEPTMLPGPIQPNELRGDVVYGGGAIEPDPSRYDVLRPGQGRLPQVPIPELQPSAPAPPTTPAAPPERLLLPGPIQPNEVRGNVVYGEGPVESDPNRFDVLDPGTGRLLGEPSRTTPSRFPLKAGAEPLPVMPPPELKANTEAARVAAQLPDEFQISRPDPQLFRHRFTPATPEMKAAEAAKYEVPPSPPDPVLAEPRSNLPIEQSMDLLLRAEKGQADLEIAGNERGGRFFVEQEGKGSSSDVVGLKSPTADWYKDLTTGPRPLKRQQIETAIQKIIQDQGVDTGKAVEQVKDALLRDREFSTTPWGKDAESIMQGEWPSWIPKPGEEPAPEIPEAFTSRTASTPVEKQEAEKPADELPLSLKASGTARPQTAVPQQMEIAVPPPTSGERPIIGREATPEEAPLFSKAAQQPAPTQLSIVDTAAHEAASSPRNALIEPTPAQKDAGNYKKGHVSIAGMDISIENPEGSTRSGTDASGKPWSVQMKSHYGYIKGTKGKDKDHLDVFIKPGTPDTYSGPVFIVDQNKGGSQTFDEHKIVLGADSIEEARQLYQANYAKDWKGLGAISSVPMRDFKRWLKSGKMNQPFSKSSTKAAKNTTTGPEAFLSGDRPADHEPNKKRSKDIRSTGIPKAASQPISSYSDNETVKSHQDYKAAKAGDPDAAVRLVRELVNPDTVKDSTQRFPGHTFVAPLAIEASGVNAIPSALAIHYAKAAKGQTETRIQQVNKPFHTGADPMQRLIAPPRFDGPVEKNGRYVLVDDVTTMGGTLAELAHHIQSHGGQVAGVITLTNASRDAKLTPSRQQVRLLETRFGDAIRELFHIDPAALTASEASYLTGFRDADALRARAARAETQRDQRLAAKGLSGRHDSVELKSEPQTDRLTNLDQADVGDSLDAVQKPSTPRIPVDPIRGKPAKPLTEILVDVSTNTGQKLTKAKLGRRVLGTYFPGSTATTIRYAGDLDTTAHELAHALDDKFGIVKDWANQPTSPFDTELRPFAEHGSIQASGPRATPKYVRAEGVAEWFRAWLVNPTKAEAAAPQFAKHALAKLDTSTRAALDQFSIDIRTHAGATAHEKTMANVQWEAPKSSVLNWLSGGKQPGLNLTWADKASAELTDRLHPFVKAIDFARKQRGLGQKPLPMNDPELLVRLYSGIHAKMDQIFEKGMIDATGKHVTKGGLQWLIDPLDKKNLDAEMQEVASYMISQRTIERIGKDVDQAVKAIQAQKLSPIQEAGEISKARMAIRRKKVSGAGAGLEQDITVAEQRIADMKAGDPAKLKRIEDAATRYRAWADANLRYLVDRGRYSQEAYNEIKANNDYYVAMNRIMEVSPGEELAVPNMRGKGGAKIGSVGQPIHGFQGSTRTIRNPYTTLQEATYRAVREADRNYVMSLFRDLLTSGRGMYEAQRADLTSVGRLAKPGEANTIPIFKNGEKELWQFHPDVYKALKGVDDLAMQLPAFLEVLTYPARIMRVGITKAPPFALRNLIRDAFQRTVVSNNGSKPWDSLKKYTQAEIDQMALAGGDQAGYYYRDDRSYQKVMKEAMRKLGKQRNMVVVGLDQLGSGYNTILEGSERQGRMAEYRRAFKKAKTDLGYDDYNAALYAASQARELLDFAVAGNTVRVINRFIPFVNAAIQGLRIAGKRIHSNPLRTSALWFGWVAIPTLLTYFWNQAQGDLDEYRQLPAYQRDLFWNFKQGPDLWLTIPKPFELGSTATTIERMVDKANGNDQAFEGHWKSLANSLLPIDEAALFGPLQSIGAAVANYDFFRDRAIVPRHEENLDLSLRTTHRASRMGQILQEAIGVDARKIDFVVQNQLGYFGRYLTAASDIGRTDRHGFGPSATGVLRGDPVETALDVKWVHDTAVERGATATREWKRFQRLKAQYHKAEGAEQREQLGQEVRAAAKTLRQRWEAHPPRANAEEKMQKKREHNATPDPIMDYFRPTGSR